MNEYRVYMSNGIDPADIFYCHTEEEADTLFAIAVASKMYTYVSAEKMMAAYSADDAWAEEEGKDG